RHRLDALGNDGLLASRHIGFAPAVGAILGLDPAEQEVLRALGAEDEALDARDFHRDASYAAMRSIPSLSSRRKAGSMAAMGTGFRREDKKGGAGAGAGVPPTVGFRIRRQARGEQRRCWSWTRSPRS